MSRELIASGLSAAVIGLVAYWTITNTKDPRVSAIIIALVTFGIGYWGMTQ